MASVLKVDELETISASGNITINNSITMASAKTLPAASLTGTLHAMSAANCTNIPAANITGTLPAISGANLTNLPSTLATMSDVTVSTSDPAISTNPSATGHLWINKNTGDQYICTDITSGTNVWKHI